MRAFHNQILSAGFSIIQIPAAAGDNLFVPVKGALTDAPAAAAALIIGIHIWIPSFLFLPSSAILILAAFPRCRNLYRKLVVKLKNIAYCWYRPVYEPFSPGKILNLITDKQVISRYVPEPEHLALAYKFFPDGLSIHGLSSLPIRPKHVRDFGEPIAEITFELVRQHDFSNAPSRLTSLYASQPLEQAEQWRQLWQGNFGNIPGQTGQSLWEIEYETDAKLYDAAWLDAALDGDKKRLFVLIPTIYGKRPSILERELYHGSKA